MQFAALLMDKNTREEIESINVDEVVKANPTADGSDLDEQP